MRIKQTKNLRIKHKKEKKKKKKSDCIKFQS